MDSLTLSDSINPLFTRLFIKPSLLLPELLQAILAEKRALLQAGCLRIMRRHTAKAKNKAKE